MLTRKPLQMSSIGRIANTRCLCHGSRPPHRLRSDRGDVFALTVHHTLEVQIVHLPGHPVTAKHDTFEIELAPHLVDALHAEVLVVHAVDVHRQIAKALDWRYPIKVQVGKPDVPTSRFRPQA
jgi:hypothetical protein